MRSASFGVFLIKNSHFSSGVELRKIAQKCPTYKNYKNRVAELNAELTELKSKCKPFLEALALVPKKVMEFIGRIIKPKYKPILPKKVLSDPYVWNIAVDPSKIEKAPEQTKKKNRGGRER